MTQILDFEASKEVADCRRRINIRNKYEEMPTLALAIFGALFITAMTWTGVVYWVERLWPF